MNRRSLLKFLALGLIAPSAITEKLLWTPKTIVTAPTCGWTTSDVNIDVDRYHRLPFYLVRCAERLEKENIARQWKMWDSLPQNARWFIS